MAEHPAASPVPAPSEPTEIPERERWLWENRDAYHSVMEGIRQAALGMVAPPASGPPPREELSRDCPECARVIAEIGGVPGGVVAEQVRAKMYAFDMAMDELRQLRAASSGGTTPSEEPLGAIREATGITQLGAGEPMRGKWELPGDPGPRYFDTLADALKAALASPVAQPDAPSEADDDALLALYLHAQGEEVDEDRLDAAMRAGRLAAERVSVRLSASPPSGAPVCPPANGGASGKQDDARDAARYRWLRETLHGAKAGGGVEVNAARQVYERPTPGEEVRVYWYQDTPVGFYELKARTLDEAIDEGRAAARSPEREPGS